MTLALVIDTETTGLPPRNLPACYAANETGSSWDNCRMVQFAWRLYETETGRPLELGNLYISPNGKFTIPQDAMAIHGIDDAMATANGVDVATVFAPKFADLLSKATVVVAHNVDFDARVIAAELYRAGRQDIAEELLNKPKHCTMKKGTLPGSRWPKLADLYNRLFGRPIQGRLHNADTDVAACTEVYFAQVRAAAPGK